MRSSLSKTKENKEEERKKREIPPVSIHLSPLSRRCSLQEFANIMEEPLETFDEQNMAKEIENVDDQKPGHDDDVRAGVTEKKWPGWPGESVFRILVPAQRVGGIIGRKGESIKKVCEESRARIKILDGPQGVPERAVMISAKEELDASISPAMDGLLKVHKHIIDGLDKESGIAPPGKAVFTRLLVPATQAGSLIGKHGATIKSIQEASNCIVRILDDRPPVALHDDRVVEIQGEPIGLHKAVELISSHLRKFLVDRSVLQLFEMQMQAPHPHIDQITPPPQPWGPPQGLPPHSGYSGPPGYGTNPGYGANSGFGSNPGYGGLDYGANQGYGNTLFMPPAHLHDNFYPPPDVPPFEKPPHHGISTYGREAPPMRGTPSNQQPPPTALQVTQHMQIPLSYADAVIGNAGASISYIRRASGATVTIQETRGVPGEMTVEITGSASQVQTAQQLIQNFMAEAAGPGQAAPPVTVQNPMGPVDQGYSSYPGHGSMYAAVPAQTGGGYGSAYGTNYGY